MFDLVVSEYLHHGRNTLELLDQHSTDSELASVAYATKGLLLGLLAKPELDPIIRQCLGTAILKSQHSAHQELTLVLIDALKHWVAGSMANSANSLDLLDPDHCWSMLAVKLSHQVRFMAGDTSGMAQAAQSAIQGDPQTAWRSHANGMLAFALEEQGDFESARHQALIAVQSDPLDAWAAHALSHTFEMTDRHEEGLAWSTESKDRFVHCNNFRFHLEWHHGLFLMSLGRFEEALNCYDSRIRVDQTDDFRDFANASSFLARLQFLGIDVGSRWKELQDLAHRRVTDQALVFYHLHQLLVFLATNDAAGIDAVLASLDDLSLRPSEQGWVAKEIGVPLARCISQLFLDKGDSLNLIRDRLLQLSALGGSHAQRDVFFRALAFGLAQAGNSHDALWVMRIRNQIVFDGGSSLELR